MPSKEGKLARFIKGLQILFYTQGAQAPKEKHVHKERSPKQKHIHILKAVINVVNTCLYPEINSSWCLDQNCEIRGGINIGRGTAKPSFIEMSRQQSTRTLKFKNSALAILDWIMKRFQRIRFGMEPSFNSNI